MITIVLAGGGTGGHVFPLLAIGEALRTLVPSIKLVFVGTQRGIESRVIPNKGETMEFMDILPLRGNGILGFTKGAARAALSLSQGRKLLTKLQANAVFSMGGYVAGPISLAGFSLSLPVMLLEPNACMGLSNRLLLPFVSMAYTAFPEVEQWISKKKVCRFGVPIRQGFCPNEYHPKKSVFQILILGGSQGSQALNEKIPQAISKIKSEKSIQIIHQTGPQMHSEVCEKYDKYHINANVLSFIEDVPKVIEASDLIIARSGASTIAEIAAVGRPAIFIPFPFAADDHQYKNAFSLSKQDGCMVIRQSDATVEKLHDKIQSLMMDDARRIQMANRSRAFGKPKAALDVAKDILARIEKTIKHRKK